MAAELCSFKLIKIGWFLFIKTDRLCVKSRPSTLLTDEFFDYNSVDKRFAYPLRAISIFEILYILMMCGVSISIVPDSQATKRHCGLYRVLYFDFLLWLIFYMIVYK